MDVFRLQDSKTPESKTIRARPPGADLPSEHGITIDGIVSIPLPPNGLYIGASFPTNTGVWHRGSSQP